MKAKPEKFKTILNFIDSIDLDDLERDAVDKFVVSQFKIQRNDLLFN